jgi:hypothetical protein
MNLDGLSLIGFALQAFAGSVSERFQGGEGAHQRLVGLGSTADHQAGRHGKVCAHRGLLGGGSEPALPHPLSRGAGPRPRWSRGRHPRGHLPAATEPRHRGRGHPPRGEICREGRRPPHLRVHRRCGPSPLSLLPCETGGRADRCDGPHHLGDQPGHPVPPTHRQGGLALRSSL